MSTGETGYICMLMTRTVLNSDFVEQVRIRCIVIPDSIKTIGILCLLEVIFPVYMQLLMRRGDWMIWMNWSICKPRIS